MEQKETRCEILSGKFQCIDDFEDGDLNVNN